MTAGNPLICFCAADNNDITDSTVGKYLTIRIYENVRLIIGVRLYNKVDIVQDCHRKN